MARQLQKKENQTNVAQANVSQVERTPTVYFTPRVDILESEEELLLYVDMPGVAADGVDLKFENGELTIHGRYAGRAPSQNCLLSEYGVGDYFRVFTVAEDIDADKISAELKNGVLTVHLPKKETVKPRRIAVKSG